MGIGIMFKDRIKDLMHGLGITGALVRIAGVSKYPRLAILVYHRACESIEDSAYLGIPRDVFEQHMKFISDNFKVVSMEEGIRNIYAGNGKGMQVAVNFDDGYMDNYIYAYPVLKKYHIPATVYLTTDYIGKPAIFWWDRVFNAVSLGRMSGIESAAVTDSINKELRLKTDSEIEAALGNIEKSYGAIKKMDPVSMLGWNEIKEMKKSGINFGSHAKTHRDLCILSDKEVIEELAGSKKDIEKNLGIEAGEFSYPFGIFDNRIKRLAKEAGFKYARAGFRGINNKKADRFSLAAIPAGSLAKTSFLAARIGISSLKTTLHLRHCYKCKVVRVS
ncbi:MAG: polysaccharide deacetylase family protein [Candidatus Omnitrophota bacterium]|nr:polysaccharide deacetylase family protein [Candidatus Omnitrophota bacterium]